jgi:eIF4-gamma/eIF5/eIF2-epsilon
MLPQVYCYEDPKLLKLFSAVIRILYDADILDEDTIKFWYKKGSHPKVRASCCITVC